MPTDDNFELSSGIPEPDILKLMSEKDGLALDPISKRLLISIVELVTEVFGAAAASIATIDTGRQLLEFKVAFGEGSHEIVGKSIALDTGIAGYVMTTGKPLTIRDVHNDIRFHHSFAEGTGYVPTSILAIPLIWGGHVIGVMEVLDDTYSTGAGQESVGLLEMFAQQAALVLVNANRQERSTIEFLEKISIGSRHPT